MVNSSTNINTKLKDVINQKLLEKILRKFIKLKINHIKFKGIKSFGNISEYEFSLSEITAKTEDDSDIDIYLRIIEKDKIKESIFCYWSLLYDEESKNSCEKTENNVTITQLEMDKYKTCILLELEDENSQILKYGTIIYFIDFPKYLKDNKEDAYEYKRLTNFLKSNNQEILLIGIKLNNSINIM